MHTVLPFFVHDADPPAKRAILIAALNQFAKHGVDGVSIRDIASESGFSNPALFRHYASKDELARALFEKCYRRLVLLLQTERDQATQPLQFRLERCFDLMETSAEGFHFVLENLRRFWRDLPDDLHDASLPGLMRLLVEAEQRAGRVRHDVDPRLAAIVIIGTLAQFARLALFDALPAPPPVLADRLWSFLIVGMGV